MSRARLQDLKTALESDGWNLVSATTTRDLFDVSQQRLSWEISRPETGTRFDLVFGMFTHPGHRPVLEDVWDCFVPPVDATGPKLKFCDRNSDEWKVGVAAFVAALRQIKQ